MLAWDSHAADLGKAQVEGLLTEKRSAPRRRAEIARLIRCGVTRVEDLADEVGVSPSTVRRDLAQLERAGELSRTYGGAVPRMPFREVALGERINVATRAKAEIGLRAVQAVTSGSTIFIDAGSTCAQLAQNLRDVSDLTVVTRGLDIAVLLAETAVDVVIVGGQVSRKSYGLIGGLTSTTIEKFRFDTAFLGCDAVDPTEGVGEPTLEEAITKEHVALRSNGVYVLAHDTKLSVDTVPAWGHLPAGWNLITDESRPPALEPYAEAGVNVITV